MVEQITVIDHRPCRMHWWEGCQAGEKMHPAGRGGDIQGGGNPLPVTIHQALVRGAPIRSEAEVSDVILEVVEPVPAAPTALDERAAPQAIDAVVGIEVVLIDRRPQSLHRRSRYLLLTGENGQLGPVLPIVGFQIVDGNPDSPQEGGVLVVVREPVSDFVQAVLPDTPEQPGPYLGLSPGGHRSGHGHPQRQMAHLAQQLVGLFRQPIDRHPGRVGQQLTGLTGFQLPYGDQDPAQIGGQLLVAGGHHDPHAGGVQTKRLVVLSTPHIVQHHQSLAVRCQLLETAAVRAPVHPQVRPFLTQRPGQLQLGSDHRPLAADQDPRDPLWAAGGELGVGPVQHGAGHASCEHGLASSPHTADHHRCARFGQHCPAQLLLLRGALDHHQRSVRDHAGPPSARRGPGPEHLQVVGRRDSQRLQHHGPVRGVLHAVHPLDGHYGERAIAFWQVVLGHYADQPTGCEDRCSGHPRPRCSSQLRLLGGQFTRRRPLRLEHQVSRSPTRGSVHKSACRGNPSVHLGGGEGGVWAGGVLRVAHRHAIAQLARGGPAHPGTRRRRYVGDWGLASPHIRDNLYKSQIHPRPPAIGQDASAAFSIG